MGMLPLAANATFKPAIARVALDRNCVLPGGTIRATYTFQAAGRAAEELSVFVHVIRPDGRHMGADFSPALPSTEWPAEGFVREGPFPIMLPADATSGQYQVWVGLYSTASGERIELGNTERERGSREYYVGDFEVVAAGTEAEQKPVVFGWLTVDETRVASAPTVVAQPGEKRLERLTVAVDRKVLNPVREKGSSARFTLTGWYSDGCSRRRFLTPACAMPKMSAWRISPRS